MLRYPDRLFCFVLLPAVSIAVGSYSGTNTDAGTDAGKRATKVSEAVRDDDGFLVHRVRSPFQSGTTAIRVLLPEAIEKGKRYPVLYVLPVEAGDGTRWGNGLRAVKRSGLHDRHGLICVAPTFAQLPWYADHPSDPEVRQESHFLRVIVPFVEEAYPVEAGVGGRLLLGFSKSGWGAFSLLLRHPDRFRAAAAWDAPLMLDRPGPYGSGPIFGSLENFEKYRVASLARKRAGRLQEGDQRLVIVGYGNFRDQHRSMHALLEELRFPHAYRDGPRRRHHWDGGWVPEAIALLVAVRKPESICEKR